MKLITVHFGNCNISFIDDVSTEPAALSLVGMFLFEKVGNIYTDENICNIVSRNLSDMYWIECTKALNQLLVKMTIKKVFT